MTLVAGLLIIIAGLLMIIGALCMELARLSGPRPSRSRVRAAEDRLYAAVRRVPVTRRHPGRHLPAHRDTAPSLLSSAQVAAHADAAHEASVPYPPEPPTAPLPYFRADRPVTRARAQGDPFTGEIPLLTDERLEQMRDEYFGRHARQVERDCAAAPAAALPAAPAQDGEALAERTLA